MSVHTQQDRVLAALKANPYRGITSVDFAAPDVIDDGKPIIRVAARIEELKHDHGIDIETAGRRNRCTIYRLTDVEGGDARSLSSVPAPVAPLSADSIPRRWFCNGSRACMGAPLDGPVCPRDASHKTYLAHYVDLTPARVSEQVAA